MIRELDAKSEKNKKRLIKLLNDDIVLVADENKICRLRTKDLECVDGEISTAEFHKQKSHDIFINESLWYIYFINKDKKEFGIKFNSQSDAVSFWYKEVFNVDDATFVTVVATETANEERVKIVLENNKSYSFTERLMSNSGEEARAYKFYSHKLDEYAIISKDNLKDNCETLDLDDHLPAEYLFCVEYERIFNISLDYRNIISLEYVNKDGQKLATFKDGSSYKYNQSQLHRNNNFPIMSYMNFGSEEFKSLVCRITGHRFFNDSKILKHQNYSAKFSADFHHMLVIDGASVHKISKEPSALLNGKMNDQIFFELLFCTMISGYAHKDYHSKARNMKLSDYYEEHLPLHVVSESHYYITHKKYGFVPRLTWHEFRQALEGVLTID